MSHCIASDQDIIAFQQAGFTATEAAKQLGVSEGAVRQRTKKLGIVFTKRQGIPSRVRDCDNCPDRKLCIMCHRLRVEALPCERSMAGEDGLPERWTQRYALLP